MTQASTLVALATYNEIENLPRLVDEILAVLPNADILVVDDNSPDGTGHWCDERASVETRLRCIHRESKLGLGSATIAAMRFAIEGGYETLVTMDSDWSHDPVQLPSLLAATVSADVVIGSRYCPEGAIDGWPLHRRLLSRVLNTLTRSLLHLPVRDSSGSYRAYRVSKLCEIELNRVKSKGYSYLEEVLWHLSRAGATFAEVPIVFRDRRAGRSKNGIDVAVEKLRTVLRLWRLPGGHNCEQPPSG
jgi:dolichol-phosphate mannosyltransferase